MGYAVLLYAVVVSPGPLLGSLQFISGQTASIWLVLDVVFWLGLVGGSVGLIRGRAWGRLAVMVAAAASIASGVIGLAAFWDSGLKGHSESSVPGVVLEMLPSVVILLAVFRLRTPQIDQPRSASSAPASAFQPLRDLTYACFAWVAIVLGAAPLLEFLPIDATTGQVLGMVFGIPLTLATLAVGLAGIVLSVVQWREWPLQVMSGLLVSLLLVFLMADEWKVVSGPLARGWYIAATLGVVSLCVRWFAFARNKGP